jgi:hypothetical protein
MRGPAAHRRTQRIILRRFPYIRLRRTDSFPRVGSNRIDVWHSVDGHRWEPVPNTPWATRHAASVFFGDARWVVAGNNVATEVWKLIRSRS